MKRMAAMMLAVSMLTVSLIGCGKQGETAGTEKEKTENTESAGSVDSTDSAGGKTVITIWGYAEQATTPMIELYKKDHPDVEFNVVTVKAEDIIQKLQTTLTAGMEMPDICLLELTQRGRLFELDCWENLEEAPYNYDPALYFDFANTLSTNSKGEIVSLQWDFDSAGVAYKRNLAKQYFGTDDPQELAKIMPDWSSFVDEGKRILEESGGKVYMMPGMGDAAIIFRNQDSTPIVNGDEINLTDTWGTVMQQLVDFRDSGIVDKIAQWSPAWYASYALDNHIFYPCATWCVEANITPNDPESDGRWGLMATPSGNYTWGGGALAICKDSKNKEAAWDFIRTALLTKEGAQVSKDPIGYYSCLKEAYDDPAYVEWKPAAFGGQNIGELLFVQAPATLQAKPITKYDHIISEIGEQMLLLLDNNPDMTMEEALEQMKSEVAGRIPESTVK